MKALLASALATVTIATPVAAQRNATVMWVGTVGFVHPFSPLVAKRRANARLVVTATGISATFEGFTGADHDPVSARTTCSQLFRLVKRDGRWSYYRQLGQGHYAGSGYVQDAPCESLDHVSLKTTLVGGSCVPTSVTCTTLPPRRNGGLTCGAPDTGPASSTLLSQPPRQARVHAILNLLTDGINPAGLRTSGWAPQAVALDAYRGVASAPYSSREGETWGLSTVLRSSPRRSRR